MKIIVNPKKHMDFSTKVNSPQNWVSGIRSPWFSNLKVSVVQSESRNKTMWLKAGDKLLPVSNQNEESQAAHWPRCTGISLFISFSQ